MASERVFIEDPPDNGLAAHVHEIDAFWGYFGVLALIVLLGICLAHV